MARGLCRLSTYQAALELMCVRNKALLVDYLLSETGLCSDPLIHPNDQPGPLHGELSEVHLMESNQMLWLWKGLRHFSKFSW